MIQQTNIPVGSDTSFGLMSEDVTSDITGSPGLVAGLKALPSLSIWTPSQCHSGRVQCKLSHLRANSLITELVLDLVHLIDLGMAVSLRNFFVHMPR